MPNELKVSMKNVIKSLSGVGVQRIQGGNDGMRKKDGK